MRASVFSFCEVGWRLEREVRIGTGNALDDATHFEELLEIVDLTKSHSHKDQGLEKQ